MTLYTIGFTQKNAERFFGLLTTHGVRRVLDVRLNNRSQLAGFAKRDDLRFFLQALGGIDYQEVPELAPTAALLDDYKKQGGDWGVYERQFRALLTERQVITTLDPALFDGACLLCSEAGPRHCHRRLVAEHLQAHWEGITIRHLE
ncbi:DUF488 family protein [Allochromatium tepidum]|uniref:DUF488 domain-containing protein n=1 Tax=Allochromatium tepidum TaxID=553982 RepID=A0ABN6GFT9_9GAMM|nr:DUF488 domain-containing protein [Allochromatium tepidum]BCU08387.1 hypothetical protein Atep_30640 [Allochromatium tepidum]